MQTTSLQTSKKIFQLMRWTSTSFYWVDNYHKDREDDLEYGKGIVPNDGDIYPAYDLAYILERMPDNINLSLQRNKKSGTTRWTEWNWSIKCDLQNDGYITTASADTPSEAAGKLCIFLAEAGILTK